MALYCTEQVEMDALVMEGGKLGVGGVAAVTSVKNPVLLARSLTHCTLLQTTLSSLHCSTHYTAPNNTTHHTVPHITAPNTLTYSTGECWSGPRTPW